MPVFDDFTTGIATQAPRLSANGNYNTKYFGLKAARLATNLTIDEQGVRVANGYTRIHSGTLPAKVDGLHFYTKSVAPTFNALLAVSNGALYYDNGSGWTSAGSGLTAGLKNRFITFNGFAIFYNGTDAVQQYDGTTMAAVTFSNPDAVLPATFRPTFAFVHVNRVFYLGDAQAPNRVWISVAGSTNNFGGADAEAIDINIGDGDQLTAGVPLTSGRAVLFKRDSIYLLTGSLPTDSTTDPFVVSQTTKGLGCIAPDTIVSVGAEVYFLSDQGFKKLSYVSVTGNVEDADPLYPAKPLLDTLNMSRATEANAAFNPEQRLIYLNIPTGASDFTTICYNVVNGAITQRTGFNTTYQVYDNAKHYIARNDTTTPLVYALSTAKTYDGTAYSFEWETLYTGAAELNSRKMFSKFLLYTRDFSGTSLVASVNLLKPDGTVTTVALDFGSAPVADGWDVGLWDVALWSATFAVSRRKNRVGRGTGIALRITGDSSAAFWVDRIEFSQENLGINQR